ncbi:MAG TPA: hypothetical protein VEA69_20795 [Tepidisphaeraceae bacterium]|nr:hypothetical protein [Tepidisphaeraceae bacterium]
MSHPPIRPTHAGSLVRRRFAGALATALACGAGAPRTVDADASPAIVRPTTTSPATRPTTAPVTSPVAHSARAGADTGARAARAAVRPALAPVSPEVRAIVARLSADDPAARDRAQAALVAVGEDAQPQLVAALARATDPEVRARLQAVVSRVEQARQVGQTRVTLDLDNVPAADAVAELARQARGPIPIRPGNLLAKSAKRVSLKVDHRPYWEVMALLCKQLDVEPSSLADNGREAGLALSPVGSGAGTAGRPWADRPTVVTGPLLVRAESIAHNRSLSLRDANDHTNDFSISFSVMAEPKLKVLDYAGTARIEEAVDDRGNSLLAAPGPDGGPEETYGNVHGGSPGQWSVGATLAYPAQPGRKIARLRGTIAAEVQIRAARLEVPLQSARGVSVDLDGVRLRVKSADGLRAEVSVARDGRGDAEWYRLRTLLCTGEAQIVDDKGHVIARSQPGADADEGDDGQQMTVRLRFARDGDDEPEFGRPGRRRGARGGGAAAEERRRTPEGAKFVWDIPVETREVVVPFMFRDLPMPR